MLLSVTTFFMHVRFFISVSICLFICQAKFVYARIKKTLKIKIFICYTLICSDYYFLIKQSPSKDKTKNLKVTKK